MKPPTHVSTRRFWKCRTCGLEGEIKPGSAQIRGCPAANEEAHEVDLCTDFVRVAEPDAG